MRGAERFSPGAAASAIANMDADALAMRHDVDARRVQEHNVMQAGVPVDLRGQSQNLG